MSRSCWQKTPKPQHSCFRILSAETKKARSENGPFPFSRLLRPARPDLAFHFLLVVIVVFEGRHGFGSAFFPDTVVWRQFPEHIRHLADVRCH